MSREIKFCLPPKDKSVQKGGAMKIQVNVPDCLCDYARGDVAASTEM